MRILLLVACALAIAGALLYEILRLIAARRQVQGYAGR
jgi:predicted outer membrane lipoprotein